MEEREVDSQRNARLKRKWKKHIDEESVMVGLSMEVMFLPIKVDCWHQSACH